MIFLLWFSKDFSPNWCPQQWISYSQQTLETTKTVYLRAQTPDRHKIEMQSYQKFDSGTALQIWASESYTRKNVATFPVKLVFICWAPHVQAPV